MAKIDVETLKFILQRNEPDIRKVNEIMQEVEMELKAEEEENLAREQEEEEARKSGDQSALK